VKLEISSLLPATVSGFQLLNLDIFSAYFQPLSSHSSWKFLAYH